MCVVAVKVTELISWHLPRANLPAPHSTHCILSPARQIQRSRIAMSTLPCKKREHFTVHNRKRVDHCLRVNCTHYPASRDREIVCFHSAESIGKGVRRRRWVCLSSNTSPLVSWRSKKGSCERELAASVAKSPFQWMPEDIRSKPSIDTRAETAEGDRTSVYRFQLQVFNFLASRVWEKAPRMISVVQPRLRYASFRAERYPDPLEPARYISGIDDQRARPSTRRRINSPFFPRFFCPFSFLSDASEKMEIKSRYGNGNDWGRWLP